MVSGAASTLSQRQVQPVWFVAAVKLTQMSAGLPAFPSVLTLVGVWTREPVQNKHGSALKGPLSVLQIRLQLYWSSTMSTEGLLLFPVCLTCVTHSSLLHFTKPTLLHSVFPLCFSACFLIRLQRTKNKTKKNASPHRVKTFSSKGNK